MVYFGPAGTPKTESTHKYCPSAPVALSIPSIRWVTHSYVEVIAIPGVSGCSRGVLVVALVAIAPGRAGFYVLVSERWTQRPEPDAVASGGRLGRDRNGVGLGAAIPAVTAGVDLAGVPQVPPVEIWPECVEKDQFGIGGLPQ